MESRKTGKAAIILAAMTSASNVAGVGAVTNGDLAGKKICWSRGASVTYGNDGFFYSDKIGNGTWRLEDDRLIGNGVRGEYIWIITKQRGSFHLQGVAEAKAESWGKYCK